MKMKKDVLVQFDGKELRSGTQIIAIGFCRSHDHILRLIEKYSETFEELGKLKSIRFKTKGKTGTEYFLTYDQVVLLVTIIRNSPGVVELKHKIVKATTLVKAMELLNSFDFGESKLRYVYAAVDESGRVKIGISNDPAARVKNLNIGNADTLQLVFTKEAKGAGYSDETALHQKCEPFKIRSEWFSNQALKAIA